MSDFRQKNKGTQGVPLNKYALPKITQAYCLPDHCALLGLHVTMQFSEFASLGRERGACG
jgi:hypothetical protein